MGITLIRALWRMVARAVGLWDPAIEAAADDLVVDRDQAPTGFLLWRHAEYVVYRRRPDGHREEIVVGRFRNGRTALRAARRLLVEEHRA